MSARTRRGKQGKQGRRKGGNGGNQMIPHPPQIQSFGLTHSCVLRFVTNAAVAQTVVTFQNLLDLINFALTTVTAADVFQAVKVKRVEMWATPVIGGATSVQCEFLGNLAGTQGDQRIHTDTSMGIEPAHVRAVPAKQSGVALFQNSIANGAFALTCPSGTVIDVALSFRGRPGVATTTQNAPVGVVAGAWYYRGLDGLAIATTVFVPVINASGAN